MAIKAMIKTSETNLNIFVRYNSFYKKSSCRNVIYNVYKGECQGCGRPIKNNKFDVAHIFPRNKDAEFKTLYPGLDVDNIINLTIMHEKCNRTRSDSTALSPILLHNALVFSVKRVLSQIHKGEIYDATEISLNKSPFSIQTKKLEAYLNWFQQILFESPKFKRWSIIPEDSSFLIKYSDIFNEDFYECPLDIIIESQRLGEIPAKPKLRKRDVTDLLIECPRSFKLSDFIKKETLDNVCFLDTHKIREIKTNIFNKIL